MNNEVTVQSHLAKNVLISALYAATGITSVIKHFTKQTVSDFLLYVFQDGIDTYV